MAKAKKFKAIVEFEVTAGNIETAKAMVEKDLENFICFAPNSFVKVTIKDDSSSIVSVG